MSDGERSLTKDLQKLVKRFSGEGTAASIAYAGLREAIIAGDLPPGRRLFAEELAEAMGFSRTPVREALRKLEAEELVQLQGRNGLVVRELSEHQLLEIYAIREALEGMAARLAAENMSRIELAETERVLNEMEIACDKEDIELFRTLTLSFHGSIARGSRNQRLFEMIQNLQELIFRFGSSTLRLPGRAAEALAAHKQLIEALKRRDPNEAETIARNYRRSSFELRLAMHRGDRRALAPQAAEREPKVALT